MLHTNKSSRYFVTRISRKEVRRLARDARQANRRARRAAANGGN